MDKYPIMEINEFVKLDVIEKLPIIIDTGFFF